MKNKYFRQLKKMKPKEIQTTIMLAFSIVSISIMLILGVILYLRFSNSAREETINGYAKADGANGGKHGGIFDEYASDFLTQFIIM